MKRLFNWLVFNVPFVAFFWYEALIPAPLFSAVFFVLAFVLSCLSALMIIALIAYFISPDSFEVSNDLEQIQNAPSWYKVLDFVFDIFMLGLLASLNHFGFAILYGVTLILVRSFVFIRTA